MIPIILLFGGVTVYSIINSIYMAATQPHPDIISERYSLGSCIQEGWLWKTGEHWVVTATFTLTNTGQSDAKVTVSFQSDGSTAGTNDFFIGAGQTQTLTYQFQAEACVAHTYHAQISGYTRTS